jgi:hypothetical protein
MTVLRPTHVELLEDNVEIGSMQCKKDERRMRFRRDDGPDIEP